MHRTNFITKLTWILLASTIAGGAFLTYVRPGWESIGMLVVAALPALKAWLSRPRQTLIDDESRRAFMYAQALSGTRNAPTQP